MDLNQSPQTYKESPKFCFEFLINGFHLMGQKNCTVCRDILTMDQTQSFEYVRREFESSKVSHQEIFNQLEEQYKQEEKVAREVNEAFPFDPDQYLQLYEIYKNCVCCKGLVYNCQGEICQYLGKCYCYERDEQDQISQM